MEMLEEVLSSVGVQDVDTSGYQVSNLDNIEFYCKNDQLDVDTIVTQWIDTPFCQQCLTNWRWEVEKKTPFCSTMGKGGEKISSPTTPVSEGPTGHPALLRNCPFGTEIQSFPVYVYRKLFQYIILCLCFDKKSKYHVSYGQNFFQKTSQLCGRQNCSTFVIHIFTGSNKLHISSRCREKNWTS